MIYWKVTITRYKKKSTKVDKKHWKFKRTGNGKGYTKKFFDLWHVIQSKSYTFPEWCDDDAIKVYANSIWSRYFKGQPKQVTVYFRGELKYGFDNLDKYMFK